MVYLVIMLVVAAAGMTRLYVQQRKEEARLSTIDGFRDSLERLAETPVQVPRRPIRRAPAQRPREVARRPRSIAPTGAVALNPERRAAARRRIEARRRAMRTRAS